MGGFERDWQGPIWLSGHVAKSRLRGPGIVGWEPWMKSLMVGGIEHTMQRLWRVSVTIQIYK